jgi:MerR family transcriptional regulator, light-induced transcriptional regulator
VHDLFSLTTPRQKVNNEPVAPTFSISAVAKATGLTAHTIRAWEKRYAVTSPNRTETNRRVYNENDVEKFKLLKHALAQGHAISMIAALTIPELQSLLSNTSEESAPSGNTDFLKTSIAAMMELDSLTLEHELERASIVLGVDHFISEVVVPLIFELDQGWEEQRVSIAQEHLASALLRTQLDRVRLSIQVPLSAPRILITTPSGQIHELGALLAAISAAREGWNVTYLGPNLPAAEIATAARKTHARVIGLSLVYPESDPTLSAELTKLRELLPNTPILIGGRASESYRKTIQAIKAHEVTATSNFATTLNHVI